jgi:hypothetical protein
MQRLEGLENPAATAAATKAAGKLAVVTILNLAMVALGTPALALDSDQPPGMNQSSERSPYVMAYDKLDVEDRQGYTTQYMFSMSKAVTRSTLEPALKPAVLLFTIPLDLILLPFAAIGGFFR